MRFIERWQRERQIHKEADQWAKKVTGSLDALRDSLARPADDPERFQAIQVASASIINKVTIP